MKSALWAISLGWELAVPIGGGALLGYYLDRRYHTGHVVTVVLLLMGVVIGYYNLVCLVRRVAEGELRQAHREKGGMS